MQYPTVEGVRIFDKYTTVITPKTEAETTGPIEIRNLANYTFTCSTLGAGEEILVDIYDHSKTQWQPYMLSGGRVKLAQHHEQLQLTASSIVLRFIKNETANPVGLVMSHPQ